MLCAAICSMGLFAACGEKEADPVEQHNPLYNTSYEGRYGQSGVNTYGDEWSRYYILNLDFITDTTVRFYGSIWLTDNSWMKDIRQVEGWNDTMRYSFAGAEGTIYGKRASIWDGEETAIRLGTNDSIQIKTKQNGFVSLARSEE